MSRDDEVTKMTCLICLGRGCKGPASRALRSGSLSCDGTGLVTPEHQSRQKLRWPTPPEAA